MKPNELQYGNLIRVISSHDGESYWEVAVHHLYENSKWHVSYDGGSTTLEDCEGIPLTEEWLMKLEFTKNDRVFNIIWCKDDFGISFEEGKYEFAYAISKEITFVHQLQNLYFALTGEELNI